MQALVEQDRILALEDLAGIDMVNTEPVVLDGQHLADIGQVCTLYEPLRSRHENSAFLENLQFSAEFV